MQKIQTDVSAQFADVIPGGMEFLVFEFLVLS
jgi:hypothetical protein